MLPGILSFPGFTSAQTIIPKKIALLTNSPDSLVRSYTKKHFTVEPGLREPRGVERDSILLADGFTIELNGWPNPIANTWETTALHIYGPHICGITFETPDPDSLYRYLSANDVPCVVLSRMTDSLSKVTAFAIDSCHPLDVVFRQLRSAETPHLPIVHRNGVFRLDWILLSAGKRMQKIFQTIFDHSTTWKDHGGYYDFWRLGPPDDFTNVRFEDIPKLGVHDPYWLSIEPDNFYWAY